MTWVDEMDPAAIPKLTQDSLQVLRDIAVGLVTIWERRGIRKPVVQVADLFFVAGGMRKTLQTIADGNGTPEDHMNLRRQLNATEPEVSEIAQTLTSGWDRLIKLPDGLNVANEIGNLIHSPIGKMGIRKNIDAIANGEPQSAETRAAARKACEDIERFNANLIELHRRILKPAAELFGAGK